MLQVVWLPVSFGAQGSADQAQSLGLQRGSA